MKRTSTLLSSAILFMGLTITGNAFAAYIDDTYIGGVYYPGYPVFDGSDPTIAGEVLGYEITYSVTGMDVNLGNSLRVNINTVFTGDNVTFNPVGVTLGDLFLSNDGYNPTAPSNFDYYGNGEDWEFALVVDDHNNDGINDFDGSSNVGQLFLFAIDDFAEDIILSDATGLTTFRNGQEVLFNTSTPGVTPEETDPAGNWLASGQWSLTADGISFELFDISLLSLGIDDLGIRWTMTCANDIIEGSVSPDPVPEPATMLLFGAGLAGLAGWRSRKKKA